MFSRQPTPSRYSRTKLALAIALVGSSALAAHAESVASAESGAEPEEVIVTGLKLGRSLQDTPTSVAVVDAVQIEEKNITSFDDSLNETANAHPTPYGGFSIRGIDGFNVSGGGNSYLASVYVDGAALPRRMINGGGFSTWDAQQIEILRGPQSTLQGRNALAGAVIMSTEKPTYDWAGKYRLQLGDYGQQEAAIAAGGALIDNELAVRISGEVKEIDGFNENVTRKSSEDYRDDETYRLKFLWQPESLPDFYAQLSLTHATNIYGNTGIEMREGDDPFANRKTYNDQKREQFVEADTRVLELSYALNDQWNISSFTTSTHVDSGYTWDSDYIPATGSSFGDNAGNILNYAVTEKEFSEELRLTFTSESLTGVIGAYYFKADNNNSTNGLNSYELNALGLTGAMLQANYGLDASTANLVMAQYASFDPARTQAVSNAEQQVTSYALFADATWSLNDVWDIYGGFRIDHESQENNSSASYTILNADKLPNPANYLGTPYEGVVPLISGINNLIFGIAQNASSPARPIDAEFTTFLPKLGSSFHFNDDLMLSFTLQKGYRSGGVGLNAAKSTIHEYDAEYTYNYEASLRSVWLDGKLVANANLFYVDWRDQQVLVQLSSNTFDTETKNAGKSNVKGFELELEYETTKDIKIYGSVGQAKSEFTDFIVTVPGNTADTVYRLDGRSFAGSPEWTSSLGATYKNTQGLFANLNINYASDSYRDVNPYSYGLSKGDSGFDLKNDARTLVNMQIGYEWERMGIYLIGRNIFDKEYISAAHLRTPALGAPRQLALSLRGSF